MTDFASLLLPDRGEPAHDLTPVAAEGFEAWLKDQPPRSAPSPPPASSRPSPASC